MAVELVCIELEACEDLELELREDGRGIEELLKLDEEELLERLASSLQALTTFLNTFRSALFLGRLSRIAVKVEPRRLRSKLTGLTPCGRKAQASLVLLPG